MLLVLTLACFKVAQNRAGKKRGKKKELGERGERRVSSPSLPAPNSFFLLAFLYAVPTQSGAWNRLFWR